MKIFRLFVVFLWAYSCSVAFALTPLLGSTNTDSTTSAPYSSYTLTGNDFMIWKALANPDFATFIHNKHPHLAQKTLRWQQKYMPDKSGNYLRLVGSTAMDSPAIAKKHIMSQEDWGRVRALYAHWRSKENTK
ncbi:MAG: hypothetical protein KAS93_03195 [Gammaproteobacteria bacterium]|nr:hypothetical protein [Gammaproteobacteria bacterium]